MSKNLRYDILLGPAQDIAPNGISDLRILETQGGSTYSQGIVDKGSLTCLQGWCWK